jgi:hypothetical protein
MISLAIYQTRCITLLSIFISLLYMFRAYMCPSLGEITVSTRLWYLSLCGVWSAGWSFTPTSRPEATHTEWQIPVSHKYSNFSWWWERGCPKHVEKRNQYTKQNYAPSWIYLQHCTKRHGQQNVKLWVLWVCILALVIRHAHSIFPAIHFIITCGLSGSIIFFSHYLINGTIF